MNSLNFNFYLRLYLIILFIFATFFFFQKYNNTVEWTISEWLINYQGGFTRRGLLGEVIFQLNKFTNLTIRETILLFQILSYLIYFYLVFRLLKNSKIHLVFIFAIFSPIFVIYPIAEVEVLGRKEIFIFISFLIVINIFSKNNIEIKDYVIFSIILSIVCLIWEGLIIYLSFFAFILFLKNHSNLNKIFYLKLFLSFLPILITFYFIFYFRLNSDQLKIMCNSVNECYGAMTYLNRNLSSNIGEVISKFKLSYLIRYILIFLIGFLPLLLLILNSKLNFKTKIKNKYFFLILFLLAFFPSFSFYYIAQDWGRWINISYTLSLFTYIFCFKNSLIILDIEKLNFTIFKKKIITTFLFILFSFAWSPKTLINEDVSSIPIYRKTINIIKSIN